MLSYCADDFDAVFDVASQLAWEYLSFAGAENGLWASIQPVTKLLPVLVELAGGYRCWLCSAVCLSNNQIN